MKYLLNMNMETEKSNNKIMNPLICNMHEKNPHKLTRKLKDK